MKESPKVNQKEPYRVRLVGKTLLKNSVFKVNDVVNNIWTFKNIGDTIPAGVKLVKMKDVSSADFG